MFFDLVALTFGINEIDPGNCSLSLLLLALVVHKLLTNHSCPNIEIYVDISIDLIETLKQSNYFRLHSILLDHATRNADLLPPPDPPDNLSPPRGPDQTPHSTHCRHGADDVALCSALLAAPN